MQKQDSGNLLLAHFPHKELLKAVFGHSRVKFDVRSENRFIPSVKPWQERGHSSYTCRVKKPLSSTLLPFEYIFFHLAKDAEKGDKDLDFGHKEEHDDEDLETHLKAGFTTSHFQRITFTLKLTKTDFDPYFKNKRRKTEDENEDKKMKTKRIPTLEIIQDQKNDKHESVFIDEIKLTALKKSLIDNEIQVW